MEPIAIIGYSFKLPSGVEDDESFWKVLEGRQNLMSEWPKDRVNLDSFTDPTGSAPNALTARGAHFINEDLAGFDAPFFSITAKEAAAMDPQHRWSLETTYRAFENAGIPVGSLKGSLTAVFGASMSDDYARMHAKDPDTAPQMVILGTPPSLLANRISYHFDLTGPSVHIDTACSSSTIAVDLACQSLRSGDATLAVVNGANLLVGPEDSVIMSSLGFLSKDGVCYSFDHRATGYGRGEGVITLILKTVSAAVRDGDVIRAVIRATGSNQDGRTPVLPQPNPISQEALIRHVYQKAGLGLEDTRYIEAHGTGTGVGDPKELRAIGNAFKSSRSPEEPLFVASLKANIGHLEAASGLAAIIKVLLILEKGIIPPCALFEKVNPEIDLEGNNLAIPTQCIPWPAKGLRRISLNSFGFGGSNCHIIMDDAFHFLKSHNLVANHYTSPCPVLPVAQLANGNTGVATNGRTVDEQKICNGHVISKVPATSSPPRLLVFTAADEKSLNRVVGQYSEYLQLHKTLDREKMDQLAFTLGEKRNHLAWRTFAFSNTVTEKGLITAKPLRATPELGLAFVFTGQGAQYRDMGKDLVQLPVYRNTMQRIDSVYQKLGCCRSLQDVLLTEDEIGRPEVSQTLCTALQIALVELLKSFGIHPRAVVGHSSGEIAAAYTIGAISLESACKIALYRGRLAEKVKSISPEPGAMISINLPEAQVSEFLGRIDRGKLQQSVCVACVNSPKNVTLSGAEWAIDAILAEAEDDGLFAQKLKTGAAYHSPAMKLIAAEYEDLLGALDVGSTPQSPVGMISTVTGRLVKSSTLSEPQYWINNLVSTVRFSDALDTMVQTPWVHAAGAEYISDMIEIGPHSALRRPIQDTMRQVLKQKRSLRYDSLLNRKESAVTSTYNCLGRLFCQGHQISLAAINETPTNEMLARRLLVDCPAYPFDHSRKYWAESRLSKDYRLRRGRYSALLGNRFSDWNALEPRWRNLTSVESHPWLADHKIGNSTIYPATGTLLMAIESVKQMASTSREIAGYFIKEASFLSPIPVSDQSGEKTETMLHLRPIQKSYEKEASWFDISVYSYLNEKWTAAFKALIQVEYEAQGDNVDGGQERRLGEQRLRDEYQHDLSLCTRGIDAKAFYKFCHEHGHVYGESFQLLEDLRWDGQSKTIASICTSKLQHQGHGIPHPTVMDAALHVFLVQTSQGLSESSPTFVPRQISDAWIAPSGWEYPTTEAIRISMNTKYIPGRSNIEGAAYALADNGKPLWIMPKVDLFPISENKSVEIETTRNKILHSLAWKPQISHLSRDQLRQACQADTYVADETAYVRDATLISLALDKVVHRCLGQLTEENRQQTPQFLQRHIQWMDLYAQDHPVQPLSEDEDIERLLQQVEAYRPPWRFFTEIARNLNSILVGATDPLELLFPTGLAQTVYEEKFENICDHRLKRLLELVSHENPNLRILEVGAGMGHVTSYILRYLEELEQGSGSKFSTYTYTDISPAFFDSAAAKFSRFQDRMTFRTFDIERDGTSQGFSPDTYDLVIAGSVIHATKVLQTSLQNLHKVLVKPRGRMVVLEMTAPDNIVSNFGFGVLPGWWLCEEQWREKSPAITEEQWDHVFRDSGFSGNDVVIRDFENEAPHLISIMATTVSSGWHEQVSTPQPRLLLVVDVSSGYHEQLARAIQDQLSGPFPWVVKLLSFTELANGGDLATTDIVVNLVETDGPILKDISQDSFASLRKFLSVVKNMLWVTSANLEAANYPEYSLATGFLRSMRSEAIDKHIVSLALEDTRDDVAASAQCISSVLKDTFVSNSPEVEFVVRQGHLMTARMVEEEFADNAVRSLVSEVPTKEPWLPGPSVKLAMASPGMLESFYFAEDEQAQADLGADEVEIECKAWGLSFRDLFVALGRLEETEFGYDCAGVVTRVGVDCQSGFKPGDRVSAGVLDCMRTFARAPSALVNKIPDGVSFETAASIFNPGVTAYYSLVTAARLTKGEKILIHSAAGSTGQMAIWVAKMLGAEVFATVGYQDKKQLLMDRFGIPEDHIFYSRNTSFAKGIMRVTSGYGVDVVLNSLAGDGLRASWECVAPYGRFVEIGKTDIFANSSLPMIGFKKNISFIGVDIFHLASTNQALASELISKVTHLAETGVIHYPDPLHIYPVSQIEEAFRFFQSGKNTGRIVISVSPEDVVTKRYVRRSKWTLSPDASYIVAGGLGGLGRAVLRWMVDKGARNLIVPSRSGAQSTAAAETVSALRARGVQVLTPACDVGDYEKLSAMLKDCSHSMPPIKGCINATMVLQDAVFENMTHAQWSLTIHSKVQTSINLHKLLPQALDFFVLFSSLGGIYGNVAQSNYAAACTYQDALARQRTAQGHKAMSLDIGWMSNIGIIAETEAYQRRRETEANMAQIEGSQLLAVLDCCLDPSRNLSTLMSTGADKSQILIGAVTPSMFLERGEDVPSIVQRPFTSAFSRLRGGALSSATNSGGEERVDAAAMFKRASSKEERADIVVDSLKGRLARALFMLADDIEPTKTLPDYGVDSLLAVELRNWIRKDFQADVAVFDIMGGATILAIGDLVGGQNVLATAADHIENNTEYENMEEHNGLANGLSNGLLNGVSNGI